MPSMGRKKYSRKHHTMRSGGAGPSSSDDETDLSDMSGFMTPLGSLDSTASSTTWYSAREYDGDALDEVSAPASPPTSQSSPARAEIDESRTEAVTGEQAEEPRSTQSQAADAEAVAVTVGDAAADQTVADAARVPSAQKRILKPQQAQCEIRGYNQPSAAVSPVSYLALHMRPDPSKVTTSEIAYGLLDYFGTNPRHYPQKLYFFAMQSTLLDSLLRISDFGRRVDPQFITVFEGSYFLRLQTGHSINTSDFDVKVYGVNGDAPTAVKFLNMTEPAWLPLVRDLNSWAPPTDQFGRPYPYKTTRLAELVMRTVTCTIQPALVALYNSPGTSSEVMQSCEYLVNALTHIAGTAHIRYPTVSLSQKPGDDWMVKVIVTEYPTHKKGQLAGLPFATADGLRVKMSRGWPVTDPYGIPVDTGKRPEYLREAPSVYAMADIGLSNGDASALRREVNELVRVHPDGTIYLSDSAGIPDSVKLGATIVDLTRLGVTNPERIPQLVAYNILRHIAYVPSPKYYYYEKKLLYCDSTAQPGEALCRNYENWPGKPAVRAGRYNQPGSGYLDGKFTKSMTAISGMGTRRWQGGRKKRNTRRKQSSKK